MLLTRLSATRPIKSSFLLESVLECCIVLLLVEAFRRRERSLGMRTRVQSLVVAFGAAVVLGVGSSFATVGVGLTPLGDLSGGSVFSAALGNSSDGAVAVGYS